jgi:general secretion pathway protein G
MRRDQFSYWPRPARGFTLVEILIVVIILGILASLVIPQFSNASQQARENTLKDELRYLRTQVTVFKAQHNDVPPGYPGLDPSATPDAATLVSQMTEHSDVYGNLSAAAATSFPYGPYLSQMPVNPVNGKNTILMIPNNASLPAPDNSTGWIYQAQTQQIMANSTGNDTTGSAYANY